MTADTSSGVVTKAEVNEALRGLYDHKAPVYDRIMTLLTLGAEPLLRRALTDPLDLRPGYTVLDVGCGTGGNFEALQRAIGPEGRIIGVDLSDGMLAQARRRVAAHGWGNVTLLHGEAALVPFPEVDAALSTFAIGLMPTYPQVIRKMVSATRPGGVILLADGQRSRRWYGRLLNPLVEWVSRPWVPSASLAAYLDARPVEVLRAALGDIVQVEWLLGTVYVAWGRRP